jgi:hypothetical protein
VSAFLGIYREPVCSPGRHQENDAAILELVAAALETLGHDVALATADDAARLAGAASIVFSMSRSPRMLEHLDRLAADGRIVVNRPAAVLASARSRLTRSQLGSVNLPAAHVVPTARAMRSSVPPPTSGEWWVKGGDLYASRREDVQRVGTMDALSTVLDDFERRGIATAVLQEHVRGREVKFYAVGEARFFYWLDTEHPAVTGFADAHFQQCAIESGRRLALEIFGGDLVIDADGRATLIDLNDWPSFAPCREAGARAIASYLDHKARDAYAALSPVGSAAPSASA